MSSVLMAKLWSLYIAAPWPFMVALERMVSAPPAKVRRRLRVMPINSLAGSETKLPQLRAVDPHRQIAGLVVAAIELSVQPGQHTVGMRQSFKKQPKV